MNAKRTQQVPAAASAELTSFRPAPALASKLGFFTTQHHLNLETEKANRNLKYKFPLLSRAAALLVQGWEDDRCGIAEGKATRKEDQLHTTVLDALLPQCAWYTDDLPAEFHFQEQLFF